MARIFGVSTRTLRHYDGIGLFSPAVTGEENLYRYYTPLQIPKLERILFLRELGIGLEVMKDLDKSGALHDATRLKAILSEQRVSIMEEVERNRRLLERIDETIHQMEAAPDKTQLTKPNVPPAAPRIVCMESFQVIGVTCVLGEGDIPQLWEDMISCLTEQRVIHHNDSFIGLCEPKQNECLYMAGFKRDLSEEVILPEGMEKKLVPAQRYAVYPYVGPTSGISVMFRKIYAEWLTSHGLEAQEGVELEIYFEYNDANHPADVKVDLCVPVRG